jgi:murein DD-endopeptidase MepM/ murein hydrolase activator NlpD
LFVRLVVVVAVLGLAFVGLSAFRIGPPSTIAIESDLPGIGNSTWITVTVEEPKRGLGDVEVQLVQGERVELLGSVEHTPLEPWKLWGPRDSSTELRVEVGRSKIDGLKEGDATIRVTAARAGAWLRRPEPAAEELTLPVKLRPPSLGVRSTHTYVSQGGCEAVVYRVGESAVRDGVQAGDWFFPGYPLPGGDERDRFALFSAPYDLEDPAAIRLIASDDVENRAEASFIDRFNKKPLRYDTIDVSDRFMERVVPAILSQTPELSDKGNLLDNYIQINNDLRTKNAETLKELAAASQPSFLWTRRFMQLPNSKVTSNFADRRTYLYEGREVDKQDHLGFDLASTQSAEIPASNNGVVVLARYFGIYGNAVVIDHGHGLMSLYGHLSSIAVEEGQPVVRGDSVGRTGATGLAGGDHLHFTLLLNGLAVNPIEWWDASWIKNRIQAKLGAQAFPFEG